MSVAPVVITTLIGLAVIADRIRSRTLEEIRLRLIHDDLLAALDDLVRDVVYQATAQVLTAIDNVRRQIDEDVALDAIALADRALFVDGAKNHDASEALGNSFQAAHRLGLETDAVFATAFIHTVNLRLAILRHFKEHYYCDAESRREFEGHIAKINGWCRQIDDVIARQHTVKVQLRTISTRPEPRVVWEATHARAGEVVATYTGEVDDLSPATRDRLQGRANASRSRAIAAERRDSGLVEMEKPAQLWDQAFRRDSGAALERDLLDRPVVSGDRGLVDGSAAESPPPGALDARAALLDALASDDFRRRIEKSWQGFLHHGDDRLVQLAHRRLLGRDARPDETALLRGIASRYGQGAFMAVLLRSQEYEARYGTGFPAAAPPLGADLASTDDQAA